MRSPRSRSHFATQTATSVQALELRTVPAEHSRGRTGCRFELTEVQVNLKKRRETDWSPKLRQSKHEAGARVLKTD
eukprot:115133-Pyramimonas_sp.AAC.1